MRTLKILCFSVAGISALGIFGLIFFLATFDPNNYKSEIETQFKVSDGKILRLNGPIELDLWPKLVIETSQVLIKNETDLTRKALAELCGVPSYRLSLTENVTSGFKEIKSTTDQYSVLSGLKAKPLRVSRFA